MSSKDFVVQMEYILDQYSAEVKRATNEAADKVSKEAVNKLRTSSPRKTGKYAREWSVKKDRGSGGIYTVTVYNKTDWQLTHLLEKPHEIINRDHQGNLRSYGFTSAGRGQIIHIKPVEEWANEEFQEEIERKLEK